MYMYMYMYVGSSWGTSYRRVPLCGRRGGVNIIDVCTRGRGARLGDAFNWVTRYWGGGGKWVGHIP